MRQLRPRPLNRIMYASNRTHLEPDLADPPFVTHDTTNHIVEATQLT
ncbi:MULTISPECIES: hypothetical protein [Streptomyces]